MQYEEAVVWFRTLYPVKEMRAEKDYPKLQLCWTMFIDNLNKNGQITDKQFSTWCCPYKRRKRRK